MVLRLSVSQESEVGSEVKEKSRLVLWECEASFKRILYKMGVWGRDGRRFAGRTGVGDRVWRYPQEAPNSIWCHKLS